MDNLLGGTIEWKWLTTKWDISAEWDARYLDRHWVGCPKDFFLTQFKLETSQFMDPKSWVYHYWCGRSDVRTWDKCDDYHQLGFS